MKFCKVITIVFLLFFISCNNPVNKEIKEVITVVEIKIPSIEKDKNDKGFNLKNGVLYFEEIPYSGTVNQFYKDGNLKSTSTYYKGKREGKYLGFYSNQNKWFERFYVKGKKTKIHSAWYQNGQQMFEYQFNNQGVYHGYVKDWHPNGQLAKHFNFENGKEVGSQKMWQSTGKIRANFFTINGERHGLIGLKNCVSVVKTK